MLGWSLLPLGCASARAVPERPVAAVEPQKSTKPGRSLVRRAIESEAKAEPVEPEPQSSSPEPPEGPCPPEMAFIDRGNTAYCIDRWEAHTVTLASDGQTTPWPPNHTVGDVQDQLMAASDPGRTPQGYISGQQASLACERAGKRLCEIDEWIVACRGPKDTRYPYGDQRQPNLCNDRFRRLGRHPVVRLFEAHAQPGTDSRQMWHPRWMNDPRLFDLDHTVAPTGSHERCTNDYGVFDMVGNLHEWVADPEGTFLGGFFMDTFQNGEGCEYRTRAHPFDYHDYSTGFRCCRSPN